ncbi:MAG TPA: vWA domain-containing protein [Polyangiaceae bacterium]|nr:vWA domain-containing protein [Polyangiaceae bacterium]
MDLVLALDSSGSVAEEIAQIQNHLSSAFSRLAAAVPEPHLVVLGGAAFCAVPPLGSGQCGGAADEVLPSYRRVVTELGGHNSLDTVVEQYSGWAPSLRAGALRSLLVVTDEDAELPAASFLSQLSALDSGFEHVFVDAVAPEHDPAACVFGSPCPAGNSCCSPAAGPLMCLSDFAEQGKNLLDLVGLTGGLFGNACEPHGAAYSSILDDVVDALIARSAVCSVPLSAAEPEDVSIGSWADDVLLTQLLRRPTAAGCAGGSDWYFNPATNTADLCPATCAALGTSSTKQLRIDVSCQ